MEYAPTVHFLDREAGMMKAHAAAHLLDGAVEAATMSQWRQQKLRLCPSRRRGV
jgi:hypothetical protein